MTRATSGFMSRIASRAIGPSARKTSKPADSSSSRTGPDSLAGKETTMAERNTDDSWWMCRSAGVGILGGDLEAVGGLLGDPRLEPGQARDGCGDVKPSVVRHAEDELA